MRDASVGRLLDTYPLISDQVDRTELSVILHELVAALKRQPGAVVEFGCYTGTTSLFIRRILDAIQPEAAFHVYDSFMGLPEKTSKDLSPAGEQFKPGELTVSRKSFNVQFKKAGLKVPIVHKGWFVDLKSSDVPDGIAFAYLDGDYYESIMDSLRAIECSLLPAATIVVDDYANEALPGAAKAVNEWIRAKKVTFRVESSLAIIHLS